MDGCNQNHRIKPPEPGSIRELADASYARYPHTHDLFSSLYAHGLYMNHCNKHRVVILTMQT